MNRWNVSGGFLRDARLKAGLSIEFIAKGMKAEPRVVLGVEKGYRAFPTQYDAQSFYRRYVSVIGAELKARLAAAQAAVAQDPVESLAPQQKENVG